MYRVNMEGIGIDMIISVWKYWYDLIELCMNEYGLIEWSCIVLDSIGLNESVLNTDEWYMNGLNAD